MLVLNVHPLDFDETKFIRTAMRWRTLCKAKAYCFQHSFLRISSVSMLILSYWFLWFLKLRVNVKSCFGRFGSFRDIQDITGNDPGDILETSFFQDFDSYFSSFLTNLKWWIWWAGMHRIWWNVCEVSQKYTKIQESQRTNSNNGQIFHNVWNIMQNLTKNCDNQNTVTRTASDMWCEYITLWAEDLLKSYSQRKNNKITIRKRKRIAFSTHFFISFHFLC